VLPPLQFEAWRVRLDGPPATFVIDGEAFEIMGSWSCLLEVLPMLEWHMPLMYAAVHPGDVDRLLDRFDDDDDDLTLADVEPVVEAVVEAATGRRWWVAQRLYATLAADFAELDGRLSLRGVDLAELLQAPARVCSLVYAHLTAGAAAHQLAAFDAKLSRPPAGLDTRERPVVTPEQEGQAFLTAAAGMRGGRLRSSSPSSPPVPVGARRP
jgi:hypothetical protein